MVNNKLGGSFRGKEAKKQGYFNRWDARMQSCLLSAIFFKVAREWIFLHFNTDQK